MTPDQLRPPLCPRCGKRLRVKPQPRTVALQLWQCKACLDAGQPALECEWTNAMLLLAEVYDDDH